MRKLYMFLFLCLVFTGLYAQDDILTKDQFLQKIEQLFKAPGNISILDVSHKTYIDSVYRLPAPLHKASNIITEGNTKDTFFFYYYVYKDFDSVLHTTLHGTLNGRPVRYDTDLPFIDSNNTFFILCFYPTLADTAKTKQLNRDVMAVFKVRSPEVTVESITIEESSEEPPPPPPSPRRKPVQKKPVKKKNPA